MNRLLIYTITAYLAALLLWTVLFYSNPYLGNVISDINLIFTATLLVYGIIRFSVRPAALEFIKVFIRTLFRVWLLIFITFAIARSMDRIGILLLLTFILGYMEGLLDINKWLESRPALFGLFPKEAADLKWGQALATILVMSVIHILCALAVLVFYLLFTVGAFR